MKISEVLRETKKSFIEEGWEFVCIAVVETSAPTKDKYKTTKYIQNLISPYGTVTTWLYKTAGVSYENYENYGVLINEYRSRWIDHMINELKKEGK